MHVSMAMTMDSMDLWLSTRGPISVPDGCLARERRPAPSSSSIRSSWLYLQTRSVRLAEPVLICPRGADGEVGDGRVFGLARAVRDDRGVAGVARHRARVERLGDRADLIQLDQQRVADAARRSPSSGSPGWSRTRRRRPAARCVPRALRQPLPAVPVAFGEAVFDRDDRVLAQPVLRRARIICVGRAVGLARLLERCSGRRLPRARSTRRRAR